MSSLREAAQRLLVALDQWREKGGPIWQCDPAIDGLRAVLARQAEPVGTRALIEECCAAFAEELAAWDIDPPLHHVKQAHDKCEAWLAAPPQQAEPVGVVSSMVKGGVIWHRWPDQMPDGTKLHAAPAHRDEPDDGNPSFG